MDTKEKNVWLTYYNDNYTGKSDQAKAIEPFLKENYKGNAYLPWAVIERLMYEQDPNAFIEVLYNKDGGAVFTDRQQIITEQKGDVINVTTLSHMVKVAVTFFNKTVIEDYPVQDKSYEAPKPYDQNMVNKALKRATAKAISRVTGLGLKLYENGDLQFDSPTTDTMPKKPVVQKTAEALKSMEDVAPQVEKATHIEITELAPVEPVERLIQIFKNPKNKVKLETILPNYNPSLKKNYGFELFVDLSEAELTANLQKIANPAKLLSAIEKVCE